MLTSQNFRSAEEIVQDEDYGDKPASLQQQIDRLTALCQSMLHRDQNPANLQPSPVGMFLIRFGLSFCKLQGCFPLCPSAYTVSLLIISMCLYVFTSKPSSECKLYKAMFLSICIISIVTIWPVAIVVRMLYST